MEEVKIGFKIEGLPEIEGKKYNVKGFTIRKMKVLFGRFLFVFNTGVYDLNRLKKIEDKENGEEKQ